MSSHNVRHVRETSQQTNGIVTDPSDHVSDPISFSQELMDKIEAAMVRYRASDTASAAEAFTEETIQELRGNLTTCVALGDERVSLALQTYELVRVNLLPMHSFHLFWN